MALLPSQGAVAGLDDVPLLGDVTSVALWPEPPSVLVVFFVAACAGIRCGYGCSHGLAVTVVTIEPSMRAVQEKARPHIMFEVP